MLTAVDVEHSRWSGVTPLGVVEVYPVLVSGSPEYRIRVGGVDYGTQRMTGSGLGAAWFVSGGVVVADGVEGRVIPVVGMELGEFGRGLGYGCAIDVFAVFIHLSMVALRRWH